VLHLLLAHHRGDQAETLAIRREDMSGPDGLAGMAAETPTGWGRLLRPLLDQPKAALTATLAAAGQDWIEDPSNQDERHARVRHRLSIAKTACEAPLANEAQAYGLARSARERQIADALALHVKLDPAGWARLDTGLAELPADLARAALARVIVTIGNLRYPPRGERLDRLLGHLKAGTGLARTLGGCRIGPCREGWIVSREVASLPSDVSFIGRAAAWDRFVVTLPEATDASGLRLGAVETVPGAARPALPAIHDLDGVLAVPHLRWVRPGADRKLEGATTWDFPVQGLAGAGFAVT
jgi:tRNA(Ile)-lysidine synthase